MKKTIFGLLFISFFALFFVFTVSEVNAEIVFEPNVRIPGTSFGGSVIISAEDNSIGLYIKALYEYGAVFVGAVAMFMLVFAGWQWLMAAGSSDKIGRAKETINGTLIGLILLFGGYLLLSQISTNLVEFKDINIVPLDLETTSDETCDTMNQRIKNGTAPDYIPTTLIDPASKYACGKPYPVWKTNEDGTTDFNNKEADCTYNLSSIDSSRCRAKKNGEELWSKDCVSVPDPAYPCKQLSGNCTWIFSGNNRPGNKCENYLNKDWCISNYCRTEHPEYECGLDQNNPRAKCELLDNVWCNSSEYCDFDGSNKWCCEDSGGTDYCRIDKTVD
ncbi:hypothetical protein HN859_03070, partial [Candidatus Parcubacteria bacterium]|nr:hypothetical protein [Candidatus Parcubacteria bacterium]